MTPAVYFKNVGSRVQEVLASPRSIFDHASTRRSQLRTFISKSVLTLLDQSLISCSNFLLGILLARWLLPAQYGAYALSFAIFLFLSLLHQALLLEPMSVLGPSTYAERLKGYFRALLWIHLLTTLAIVVVLGMSAWIVDKPGRLDGLPGALAGVALASPWILLFHIVRRAFYWELTPGRAAAGAVLYCVLLVSGLTILYWLGFLTSFSAFLLMGIAALATSVWQLIRLQLALKPSNNDSPLGEVWHQHWSYGRWAMASSLAIWIPGNMYFILLDVFGGMTNVGVFKALMNLTLPIAQTFTALSLFFLSYAARTRQRDGSAAVERLAWKITMGFAGASIVYWSLIVLLRGTIVHLLYAGKYGEITRWVPWIALYSCFWCAAHGQAIGLRAMLSPASVFYAYGVASVSSVAIGIPAMRALGIPGAIATMILSSGAGLSVVVVLLRRKVREAID